MKTKIQGGKVISKVTQLIIARVGSWGVPKEGEGNS